MPELVVASAHETPATPPPAWLSTREELQSRPLEKAYAVDPKDPVEIDDAIRVESRAATEHRVAVYICDIGLIANEAEALGLARARGWTRYGATPDDRTITMFSRSIYEPLGLDKKHYGIGAPAIKIGFSLNPQTGTWGEADFSKVTVKAATNSYAQVDKYIASGAGKFANMAETSRLIARVINNAESLGSRSSISAEMVARFMVMANFVAAEEMEKLGVPWLYRNHGIQAIEQLQHISDEHRSLFRKFMRAIYNSEPSFHVGLGLGAYCHLTSGLRRFPDTANGLNLDSIIEGQEPVYDNKDMTDISREMTEIYRKKMVRRPKRTTSRRRTVLAA